MTTVDNRDNNELQKEKSTRCQYQTDFGKSQILGGAEQLIVSIGCSLKKMGHDVIILTSHHDHNHCFDETKKNGKSCGIASTQTRSCLG